MFTKNRRNFSDFFRFQFLALTLPYWTIWVSYKKTNDSETIERMRLYNFNISKGHLNKFYKSSAQIVRVLD